MILTLPEAFLITGSSGITSANDSFIRRRGCQQGGVNGFGEMGCRGPCPPPGKPHRYFFKLYALECDWKVLIILSSHTLRYDTWSLVWKQPSGVSKNHEKRHLLKQAEFFETYQRYKSIDN